MKRLLALFSALIVLRLLCGCGGAATETAEEEIDLTRTTAAAQNALDGTACISYDLVRWNGTETEKVQSELYKDIA